MIWIVSNPVSVFHLLTTVFVMAENPESVRLPHPAFRLRYNSPETGLVTLDQVKTRKTEK